MKIWVDGSARGNGTANCQAACRIVTEAGVVRTTPLGNTTNNIAEVEAIRRGLEYAIETGLKDIEILTDSQCALAWIKRGRQLGAEKCISKASSLPLERKALVRAAVGDILALSGRIKRVKISWCPGEEQRADFGNKGKRRR